MAIVDQLDYQFKSFNITRKHYSVGQAKVRSTQVQCWASEGEVYIGGFVNSLSWLR